MIEVVDSGGSIILEHQKIVSLIAWDRGADCAIILPAGQTWSARIRAEDGMVLFEDSTISRAQLTLRRHSITFQGKIFIDVLGPIPQSVAAITEFYPSVDI